MQDQVEQGRSIFEFKNEDDYTKDSVPLCGDRTAREVQELGYAAASDLAASVANIRRSIPDGDVRFQDLFQIVNSALKAWNTGASYESVIQTMQNGWCRARQEEQEEAVVGSIAQGSS